MREQLPVDSQVLQSHLIEDVSVILVVLVKDQPNMRAGKLEVQCFFLTLLERGLHVIMRSEVAQKTVLALTAQFNENLHHPRYLVLMEKQL